MLVRRLLCFCLILAAVSGITQRNKTVCVTGASGYVASVLVHELIAADYFVVGTVRDLSKFQRQRNILSLAFLQEADIMDEASLATSFSLCHAVMHTASPFWRDFNPALIKTAVDGTNNVLRAAKAAGIETVVVTSSCAAVTPQNPKMVAPVAGIGQPFSEADWNTDSTETAGPYRLSKRLAEQALWDFANSTAGEGMKLVAVNPAFVLGPPVLNRITGESMKFMKGMLEGSMQEEGAPGSAFGAVDVRDLAIAHIRAMQRPEADRQRFVLSSEESYSGLDIANKLPEDIRSRFKLPVKLKAEVPEPRNRYTSALAEAVLGVKLRPIEATVADMANELITRGIVYDSAAPHRSEL